MPRALTILAQLTLGALIAAIVIASCWWLTAALYLMPLKGQIGLAVFAVFVAVMVSLLAIGSPKWSA